MNGTVPRNGWVLATGKAGHANQCIGVLERLGIDPIVKTVRPGLVTRLLAPRGIASDGTLGPPWPDLVLASGRQTIPFARRLKAETGGKTLVGILGRPGIAPRHFDFVWANTHDRLAGDNVLTSLTSPHRVTKSQLEAGKAAFAPTIAGLPARRVGVLIGGPSRVFRFDQKNVDSLAAALGSIATGDRAGLIITLSRRTPSFVRETLNRHLEGRPYWLWDGEGESPIFGILGLADHLVVTGDSVNMLSEAAFTGKPLHAVRLPGRKSKFDRFHQAMIEAEYMRWFDGTLPEWSYDPPDATGLIADHISSMFQDIR